MMFALKLSLCTLLIQASLAFNVPNPGRSQKQRLHSKNHLHRYLQAQAESNEDGSCTDGMTRRELLAAPGQDYFKYVSILAMAGTQLASPQGANAAVTDETNNFAVDGSAYIIPESMQSSPPTATTSTSTSTSTSDTQYPTDETTIRIPMSKLQSASLGIELADVEFRTNRRVYVKSVLPSSLGAQYNITPNLVLVKINNQSTERTNAKGVAQIIGQLKKTNAAYLLLTFRDDSFQKQLQNLSDANGQEVTTQIAPGGDTTQRNQDGSVKFGFKETKQEDQNITIQQLIAPKMCKRGANVDDLLEISYIGSILETGDVFDGSAVRIDGAGIPGRGNDVSILFVLGKQPFGQFPPGWDVGLRCVYLILICLNLFNI